LPDQTFHAFLWTARDGVLHDLGTLGGTISIANAISDDGVVVGASATAPNDFQHAFMWTRHAGMVDLGTLGGFTSVAQGVNDNGVIVGTSQTSPSGENHAFIWTRHTGMVDIGKAGLASFGEKINGRVAIGQTFTLAGTKHGFAWTRKDGFVDLGTLNGDTSSFAGAVSDRGLVVGNSFTPGIPGSRAFVWSASSGINPLSTPIGGSSQANAINDDFIAGSSCDSNQTCHATLWEPPSHSHTDRNDD
jgi:probable HAF family extracellular repeat protein